MADLIIDPGHGGTDPGANGFGVLEKDWNLKISLYQYNRLKELGASVAITRTTDKTIESTARGNLIKSKHKYCMSNHFNAFNGSARGVETIHSIYAKSTVAKRLADTIVKASRLPLRRVFDRKFNGGDYYFMHRLTGTTSTIIVEYGFIDNKEDHDFYKNENNFYNVAEAVVKEWCAILGVKYVAPGGDKKVSNTVKIQTGGLNNENLNKVIDYFRERKWYGEVVIHWEHGNPKVTSGGLTAKMQRDYEAWLEKQGFWYKVL